MNDVQEEALSELTVVWVPHAVPQHGAELPLSFWLWEAIVAVPGEGLPQINRELPRQLNEGLSNLLLTRAYTKNTSPFEICRFLGGVALSLCYDRENRPLLAGKHEMWKHQVSFLIQAIWHRGQGDTAGMGKRSRHQQHLYLIPPQQPDVLLFCIQGGHKLPIFGEISKKLFHWIVAAREKVFMVNKWAALVSSTQRPYRSIWSSIQQQPALHHVGTAAVSLSPAFSNTTARWPDELSLQAVEGESIEESIEDLQFPPALSHCAQGILSQCHASRDQPQEVHLRGSSALHRRGEGP